jgi:NAD(P)-dependent dehydrogenase (short-subunit alcohol dehydrogenase family)
MDLSSAFSLHGKVAIVTGASRGIGYSIAEFFGAARAKVVLTGRNPADVDEKADKLKKKGYDVTGVQCSVEHTEDLKHLVEKTIELYGHIDVLVNNAGVNPTYGNIQDLDAEVFDKLMNINVKAPFELSKICFPYLMQSSSASIINIGAAEGIKPEPKLGLFGVSKAALISLTKAFAKEWGDYGIRVNVICPGLTKTSSNEILWSNDRLMVDRMKRLPIKRMGERREIAAMALFLASSASSFTTGTVMTVDGGLTI